MRQQIEEKFLEDLWQSSPAVGHSRLQGNAKGAGMADKELILRRFSDDLRGSSESVRNHRLYYAEKFLNYAGGVDLSRWNRDLVDGFIAELEKEGYAEGSIKTVLGIVKRVFDAAKEVSEGERNRAISEIDPNDPSAAAKLIQTISKPGPQWDVGKRVSARVGTGNVLKPSLTLDEVRRMVSAAKSGFLDSAEAFFLAFTSIYGLRREELRRLRREHFDFNGRVFWVDTAKGGERRYQLLCDEAIPYVENHDFRDRDLSRISRRFDSICDKAGVEKGREMGWHALRRMLDTLLIDRFGELPAKIFLRWRLSSSAAMELRYYTRDPLAVDREVLSGHPVLELWRDKAADS